MSSVLISLTAYLLFSIRRYEFAEIDRISTLRLAKLIILAQSLNKRNCCTNAWMQLPPGPRAWTWSVKALRYCCYRTGIFYKDNMPFGPAKIQRA